MIGSISAVSSASTVRHEIRRERPAMVSESARTERRADSARGAALTMAMSDTGGLLFWTAGAQTAGVAVGVGVGASGFRFLTAGGTAGEGEEDVVEGGAVQREPPHRPVVGVDLVEQPADVRGAAVGGDGDGQAGLVAL